MFKPCSPVFFLFAFLIINDVAAQSGNYKPGYLITTENDTIHGFIINKSWQEIVFWDSLDNKMHYAPGGTVKGFVRSGEDKLAVAPKGNRKFNSFIIPYMKDHMDVVKSIPEEMFFSGNLISIVRQYNLVAGKR